MATPDVDSEATLTRTVKKMRVSDGSSVSTLTESSYRDAIVTDDQSKVTITVEEKDRVHYYFVKHQPVVSRTQQGFGAGNDSETSRAAEDQGVETTSTTEGTPTATVVFADNDEAVAGDAGDDARSSEDDIRAIEGRLVETLAAHWPGDPVPAAPADANDTDDTNVENGEDDGEDDGEEEDGEEDGDGQADDRDHFVWLANVRDAMPDDDGKCPACDSRVADEEKVYLHCGHVWCSDCLNNNFRAGLSNRASYPPRCCHVDILFDNVAGYLEDEVLVQYYARSEEFASPNPTYCQTKGCGVFIPDRQVDGQWATCLECTIRTCVECKASESTHPSETEHPDPISKEDKELAEKEGWQRCPNCRNVVEKTEGCDFMTCECGIHFCWRCGSQLPNSMPCSCTNPQWVADLQAWQNGVDQVVDADADGEDEEGGETEEDGENEEGNETEEDGDDDSMFGGGEDEDGDENDEGEGEAAPVQTDEQW